MWREKKIRKISFGFRSGLSSVGWLPVLGGLGLAACILFGIGFVLRFGAFTVISEKYLLQHATDQLTHILYRLSDLKWRGVEANSIYLLGGSGMRECVESEERIASELLGRTGRHFSVHNFGYYHQSLMESGGILDHLPRARALAVLGVSIGRVSIAPDDFLQDLEAGELLYRWIYTSKQLDQYLHKTSNRPIPAYPILPSLVGFARAYVRMALPYLKRGELPSYSFQSHLYDKARALSIEAKRKLFVRAREKYLPGFHAHLEANLKTLEWVIHLGRQKGFLVTLLQLPMNPAIEKEFESIMPRYRTALTTLSKKLELPLWDLNGEAQWNDEDFFDGFHVVESGWKKFESPLVQRLVQTIGVLNSQTALL